MKSKTCKDCKHFRQHYIRFGRSYREAHCGHCVYPRVKRRTPDAASCICFEQKPLYQPDADAESRSE